MSTRRNSIQILAIVEINTVSKELIILVKLIIGIVLILTLFAEIVSLIPVADIVLAIRYVTAVHTPEVRFPVFISPLALPTPHTSNITQIKKLFKRLKGAVAGIELFF